MTGAQMFTAAVIAFALICLAIFVIVHDQILRDRDKAELESHDSLMQEIEKYEMKWSDE